MNSIFKVKLEKNAGRKVFLFFVLLNTPFGSLVGCCWFYF